VDRVIAHHLAVPLPAVAGAREPVWAAESVIADERQVAALAEQLATSPAPAVDPAVAVAAVTTAGVRLTTAQRQVATGLLASGHGIDVLVGVAGSGKTTTLSAVRAGFEAAGYTVIGAATSGQAAHTLAAGAGIDAHTVASLAWQLEHDRIRLTARHVLVLDEAGMTTDTDIARLFGAARRAGAKVILAGDYHQLDAIGPGGALEALALRHPDHLWTLVDNLRQHDPGERAALDHLRAGNLDRAVAWYSERGRVHPAASQGRAVEAMVTAWTADVAAGRNSVLLAYRRANVDALNRAARTAWSRLGRLSGPQLHTDAGVVFQAGDRVITLTPGPDRAWTTSQAATVTAVDLDHRCLTAVTPDGRRLHIPADYVDADHLAYGYAVTAHRSQGATVDAAHVLADGGGRELAYVAMSRATGPSHVHIVSPTADYAADRLAWAWQTEQRQTWTVPRDPALTELQRRRHQLVWSIPADRRGELGRLRDDRTRVDGDLRDLQAGTGRWDHHPVGRAARALRDAQADLETAQQRYEDPTLNRWAQRRAGRDVELAAGQVRDAYQAWHHAITPSLDHYRHQRHDLDGQIDRAVAAQKQREEFLDRHPDIGQQIRDLDQAITERKELQRLRQERDHDLTAGHHLHAHEDRLEKDRDLGLGL
jgi:hypothetical protein